MRIDANGKITQWRFDHDIICEKATIERASTTGMLVIKAPIVGYKPRVDTKHHEVKKEEPKKKIEEKKKELKPIKDKVDFLRNDDISTGNTIKEVESFEKKDKDIKELVKECDVDIDELPDLE